MRLAARFSLRAATAAALAATLLLQLRAASAETAQERNDGPTGEVGIGLTAGSGNTGFVGALRAGLAVWYSPVPAGSTSCATGGALGECPRWAFGLQLEGLGVDNGADPQYAYGALASAWLGQAFADVRFLRGVVTPFARVGVGLADASIIAARGERDARLLPFFGGAIGPELRLGPVYVRLQGTLTAMQVDTFFGWGAELGGAWPRFR